MKRLRWRVARWLVGPFVTIPERKGTWIVMHPDEDPWTVIVEADKFRLRMQTRMHPLDETIDFGSLPPATTGRFVGTVRPH